MALQHAVAGAVIDVRQGAADLSHFSAIALAKTAELELIRMALPKGKAMPEHHVPGELTLLCLEGEVELDMHGRRCILGAGQMIYLSGGQAHAVQARQDSLLLLTILLLKGF